MSNTTNQKSKNFKPNLNYPSSVNARIALYHTKEEREMFQLQARCKGLENWKSKN